MKQLYLLIYLFIHLFRPENRGFTNFRSPQAFGSCASAATDTDFKLSKAENSANKFLAK